MTRNQISALELQETRRSNLEKEKQGWTKLPAEYISSVGSVLGGVGKLMSGSKALSSNKVRFNYPGREYAKSAESFQYHI